MLCIGEQIQEQMDERAIHHSPSHRRQLNRLPCAPCYSWEADLQPGHLSVLSAIPPSVYFVTELLCSASPHPALMQGLGMAWPSFSHPQLRAEHSCLPHPNPAPLIPAASFSAKTMGDGGRGGGEKNHSDAKHAKKNILLTNSKGWA